MSTGKAGIAAFAAFLGAGAVAAHAEPVTVQWLEPDPELSPFQGISFAPIDNVFRFDGVDRGVVQYFEDAWGLYVRLDGVWTEIFGADTDVALDTLAPISFGAGTLDAIGFRLTTGSLNDMEGATFTFTRQTRSVPEPGSLALLAAALGAFGIRRGLRLALH